MSGDMLISPFEIPSYKRFPMVLERGKGCYVETDKGERYLDLYGGHAVVGLGHSHPAVVSAIGEQMEKLMFYSNLAPLKIRHEASEILASSAPGSLNKSFLVNSGAEANENALKIARLLTKRSKVISFNGGFHGRTAAAIAATGIDSIRNACQPLMPDHIHLPFNDLAAVESRLKGEDIACVLLEPIQSMAGIVEATPEFLMGLRQACDAYGTMLIYDEVQTGIGRTGEFLFAGTHGIMPDLVTLGKAIASGFPAGAVLADDAIGSKISSGDLGSTFGGGPLASAAIKATLETIQKEGLLDHVKKVSGQIKERAINIPVVREVRGQGLLLGLKFNGSLAKPIQQKLLGQKIITGGSNDPEILRLLPPLTLGQAEVDQFIEALAMIEVAHDA